MKLFSGLFVSVLVVLITSFSSEILTGQNLIPNPGFELGSGNEFTNWSKFNGNNFMTATAAADEVRSGDRAMRTSSTGFPGEQWRVQLVNDDVPTIVGNQYTFTIWAKAASAGGNIRFSTMPNPLYGPDLTLTAGEWTQLTWSFTANEAMTRIVLDLGQTNVTFFLDDAEMIGPAEPCVVEYETPASQEPISVGKNKFFGSIYSPAQSMNHANYFNQVTPENAGKWGSVERVEGTYDFSELDEARAYAKANDFPFRFHVMLWGNQQPAWLKPMTDEEKVTKIRAWFQAVSEHYDGSSDARATLEYLEVANEIINDPPNNLDNSPFSDNSSDANSGGYVNALKTLNEELGTTPGEYDWIVNAFKLAREYFPCETRLVLNEYNVLTNYLNITDKYLEVVELLQAENLVDVLGFQGHAFSTRKYDDGTFENHTAFLKSNIDRLAATGLPLQVTEMDVDGNVDENYMVTSDVAVRDAFQKREYERIFGLFWNHPAITGVTLWGFRTGHWRTEQLAYLIDPCTGIERPALREFLNNTAGDNAMSIRAMGDPALTDFGFDTCIPSSAGNPNFASIDIVLAPNPATTLVNVQFPSLTEAAELKISDGIGRVVSTQKIARGQTSIALNLDTYKGGLYYLTLQSATKRVTRRLVVAH